MSIDILDYFVPGFKDRHPRIHAGLYTSLIWIALILALSPFHKSRIERPLISQISVLEKEKISLIQENQELKLDLLPFKNKALELYPTNESKALSLLANKFNQLEVDLITLLDYQEVSRWGFLGGLVHEFGGGGSFSGYSPADGWADNIVQDVDGKIETIKCGTNEKKSLLETIELYPLYPFPYYILSECLKENGERNDDWLEPRERALEILKKTTQVPRHHPDHDAVLIELLGGN